MRDSTEPPAVSAAARRHLMIRVREALGTGPAGGPARLPEAAEEAFVCAIMRHRIAALLYPAIEEGRIAGELPVDVPGLCRQAYFTILRRNLVTLEHGEALLTVAREAGLELQPRGPWAWLQGDTRLFADPGVRPADGLRFAVAPCDRPEFVDLARRLGFAAAPGPDGGDPAVLWKTIGRLRLPIEVDVGPSPSSVSAALFDAVSGLERVRYARWLGLIDVH
jgi:hypothetical protein